MNRAGMSDEQWAEIEFEAILPGWFFNCCPESMLFGRFHHKKMDDGWLPIRKPAFYLEGCGLSSS